MNHPADTNGSAEDEALRWLVDFDDISEVEQARFQTWLDARPENRRAFEKLEREWRELDVVRQLATDAPDPDVVNKWLWRRRLRRRYLPLAAAAAGIAAVAMLALLLPRQDYEAGFRTAIGQHREIKLPDESVMTLNTNSEASVQYDADERRVRLLRGEAHFVVTAEPARPFSVIAGSGTVRAVGTAFNVYLKDDVVEVTVTKGIVEVLPNAILPAAREAAAKTPAERPAAPVAAAAERLGEGQKLEYRETIESVSRVDPQEIARKLAWQHGMLDFQGDTLAAVIEEASRYTRTRITIDDPEIEGLHVTGYFRAGDIDTLLELIDANERVAVRRVSPGLVHITASERRGQRH